MEPSRSRSDTSLQDSGFRHLYFYIDNAYHLIKGDTFGLSDPYVQLTVVGATETVPSHSKKTSVQKKTLTPLWREQVDFWIKGDQFSVILDVFDDNRLFKDDFLGRQIMHFDFTDTVNRPHVIPSLAPRTRIVQVGRHCRLRLMDKYTSSLLESYDHFPHVAQLRSEFFLKRLSRHRTHVTDRGAINLYYVFVDVDVGDDFEHVEAQDETTPTQTSSETAAGRSERAGSEVELPPGWEERVAANGRRIYVNHLTRGVSVRRPGQQHQAANNSTAAPVALPTITSAAGPPQRRVFLERHTSIEVIEDRTGEEEEEEEEETPPPPEEGMSLHHLDSVSMITHPHPPSPSPSSSHLPGLPYPTPSAPPQPSVPPQQLATPTPTPVQQTIPTVVVQATPTATPQSAQQQLNLGAVAARIPLGASPQHSLALQRAAQDLAEGWQAGMTTDGRIYYINHHNHTTTWEKPRLQERRAPRPPRPPETQPAQPPMEQDPSLPEGWEQRQGNDGRVYYVDHNTHSTSWDNPTKPAQGGSKPGEGVGPLPGGWQMKQMADGRLFFVDHTTHSTQWEDPRLQAKNEPAPKIQYSRDYKQKYTNFRSKLPKLRAGVPNFQEIPVRRDNLFEDSFTAVTNVRNLSHFHSRLYVKFAGEQGLDYGGLAREWFYLLSHEMFSPYYGLFEYAASDDYTLQISPESGIYNEHHLDYFKFVGRMMGLAIYHQHLLDAFFIRPFYKMLLNKKVTLKDMQSVDEELYNSVQYVLDNDPEPLCLNFSANKTVLGQVLEEELKPGGADIAVTESNKREYINLLIKWRFTDRVQTQMDAIKKGIADIVPPHLMKVFDEREVEYLLGGLSSIDVEDWRKNTDVVGYSPHDNVIIWFWKAVENYDNEMRARLLQFVTGTSKVPMNGFAELQGSNGPRKFCIKRLGAANSLPRAHTCFNRIDLPPYASYHKLKENLKLAVENTEGFEGVD